MQQVQYLRVKERLDFYHLPTSFSIESLPLLTKLIAKIDQATQTIKQINVNKLSISKQDNGIQATYKFVDKAVKAQLTKVIQQNNSVHLQILCLKQQLQTAKHCLDKIAVQKSDNKQQISQIIKFKNIRQNQLFEQLQATKFKYNQLVDFIHNEDNLEKMYIKRLFNHKKYDLNENDNNSKTISTDSKADDNNINKRKRIAHTLTQKQTNPTNPKHSPYQSDLILKLKNRQCQIQRLHKKLQFDGLNMNKVLVDFQSSIVKKKVIDLESKLEIMSTQYQRMKKQVDKTRKTGGRYQALRQQLDKSYQLIKQLKMQNHKSNTTLKENQFDLLKQKNKLKRQSKQVSQKVKKSTINEHKSDIIITDLKKKVQFYQKQLFQSKSNEQKSKSNNAQSRLNDKKSKQNDKKSKSKVNGKKEKSNIEQKNEDDLKQYKKESQIRQKYLNQISLYGKKQQHKIAQIEQQSSQQEDQQQNFENKDNIPIEKQHIQHQESQIVKQYRQKLKQLTKQYLLRKQQTNLKDQSIQNLQKIIDRLMKQRSQFMGVIQNQQSPTNILPLYHANNHFVTDTYQKVKNWNNLHSQKQSLRTEKQSLRAQNLNLTQILRSLKARLDQKDIQLQNLIIQSKQWIKNQEKKQIQQKSRIQKLLIQIQTLRQQLKKQLVQNKSLQNKLSKQSQHISLQNLNQSKDLLHKKQVQLKQSQQFSKKQMQKLVTFVDKIKQLNDQLQILQIQKQQLRKQRDNTRIKLQECQYKLQNQRIQHQTSIKLWEFQKEQIIKLKGKINKLQHK